MAARLPGYACHSARRATNAIAVLGFLVVGAADDYTTGADAVVTRALMMLADAPEATQIRVSHLPALWKELGGWIHQLEANPDATEIRINAKSRAYRDARNGRPVELAGILAHEHYHAHHGADEGPAYDEQLRVLRGLGANDDLLREVAAAKTHALREGTTIPGTGSSGVRGRR